MAGHPWRREEFTSNILLGGESQRDVNQKGFNAGQFGIGSIETSSTPSSHTHRGPIYYGPVSSHQYCPSHPITHIASLMNGRFQMELIFSDAAGQIFVHDPHRAVVSQLLIPTSLQPSHEGRLETSDSISSSCTPESSLVEREMKCFEDASPPTDSYERAFREEMVKNDLRPFRSNEPIIELKVNLGYHWALTAGSTENICVSTVDLIHSHSITRIGYLAQHSYDNKVWCVPQVIHITTILTLPTSVPIASCEFFPGVPRGPAYKVGPLIFTQHGSGHIYMAQPNSTRPPTILIHAKDLIAMMPTPTSIALISSPPILSRCQPKWTQAPGSPGDHPLLVMFNGYVFRIGFDPINLTRTQIEVVIGNSPHHPSSVPFFRPNSQEYRLQELNANIFVMDCLEGAVSQFSIVGELRQCIQPSPPSGLPSRTPIRDFFVYHDPYESSEVVNIYLIDSFGAAIYLWTSNHDKQCQYDLNGYPSNANLTRRMKRPQPLRPAITLKPTVLAPATPLVYHATKGWQPYRSRLYDLGLLVFFLLSALIAVILYRVVWSGQSLLE